jgi:uncharacterized iron-regulated membrane protein
MGNNMRGISGKWIYQIHRYGGLILGLWILAICLSGAVLVYAPEIEMAAARSNASGADSMSLEHVVQTVMSQFPGFRLRDIRFNSAGAARRTTASRRDKLPRDRDFIETSDSSADLII